MTGGLPKLAVYLEDGAFSPWDIKDASSGLCQLVWVVGWSKRPVTFPGRVLQRMGEVVEVTSSSPEENVQALRPFGTGGIIAFTDPPQHLAAVVAEAFGFVCNSPRTALMLSDKVAQRQGLRAAGVPVPGFIALGPSAVSGVSSPAPVDLSFPAVLKPRGGSGGRDTFLVNDEAQLRSALAECPDEDFVLEEYISGRGQGHGLSPVGADIVSVETVVEEGEARHFAVTGRFPFAAPFRETGSFLPSDLSADDIAAVYELATAATQALDIRQGVLHTELKLRSGGPWVIEVNGRVGGGEPQLLASLGRPGLLSSAMRLALGLKVGAITPLAPSPVAFIRLVPPPFEARQVVTVGGLDQLRSLPGVETVRLNRQPGDRIGPREGGAFGHVLWVEGRVADHQALARMVAETDAVISDHFEYC